MRKLYILFLLFFAFFSFSCEDSSDNNASGEQKDDFQDENISDTYINFKNNSAYMVQVYYADNPYRNTEVFASIPANSSQKVKFDGVTDKTSTFYFVYNFNFGKENIFFPYFSSDSDINHKSLKVTERATTDIIIDEISKCSTKSAFLLLDNQTTSSVYILLVDNSIIPYGAADKFISPGACAVYEIGDEGNFILESAYRAKICMNSQIIDLPEINYEPGSIYSVVVTNEGSALKSVSPFDVDTERQMWNFDDKSFRSDESFGIRPVMRGAYDKSKGSLVCGTLASDDKKIGLMSIDVYGQKGTLYSAEFPNTDWGDLNYSSVLDFVQQSDGSLVMLLENYALSEEDSESGNWYESLVCYNFETSTLLWSAVLQDSYAQELKSKFDFDAFYFYFNTDSTNSIYRMEDNKIALAGAVDNGETMYPFFSVIDAGEHISERNQNLVITSYYSSGGKSETESMFTSVYYNGSDFYVSGYENWDITYENLSYSGVVYKFTGDLQSVSKVYEKESCILFCIDGNGSNWYACGEYCDTGKILKGCFISSEMLAKNEEPALHVSEYSYCWFDQLCSYDGKLVLYGTTSMDTFGENTAIPIVTAYKVDGSKLWENKSYDKYTSAYSLIPNAIGTYVLQLASEHSNTLHYVSADLLGNE